MLAYIDSLTSGLVPCKVLDRVTFQPPYPFSEKTVLSVRITSGRPGYSKGETLDVDESMVIPRNIVRKTRAAAYISAMSRTFWAEHFAQ